jgi:hypothetical protein
MHSKQEGKPPVEEKSAARPEKTDGQRINAAIGKHVVRLLGQPGDLHTVQVRQLWDNHFRVNVFIGLDAGSLKLAHSYFLLTDGDGNILESTPEIAKQYL